MFGIKWPFSKYHHHHDDPMSVAGDSPVQLLTHSLSDVMYSHRVFPLCQPILCLFASSGRLLLLWLKQGTDRVSAISLFFLRDLKLCLSGVAGKIP